MAELRRDRPERSVELWAEDEARLGPKPIARGAWAVTGRRPAANGRTKDQWLYVYGFVHPASGRDLELIPPAANTDWMAPALAEFARRADPEGTGLRVVPVDNAGWPIATRLARPPSVVLHRRPPCTPELQPAEPPWPPVREAVASEGFDELGEMEPVLVERCRWLIENPEVVRGAIGFQGAVNPYG